MKKADHVIKETNETLSSSGELTDISEYNGILVPVRASFSLRRRGGKAKNLSTLG